MEKKGTRETRLAMLEILHGTKAERMQRVAGRVQDVCPRCQPEAPTRYVRRITHSSGPEGRARRPCVPVQPTHQRECA